MPASSGNQNCVTCLCTIVLVCAIFSPVRAQGTSETESETSRAEWTSTTIDDAKRFRYFSRRAIALDNAGDPHVVYGGDHLYYAYRESGVEWRIQTLDPRPNVGAYSSIRIDLSGGIHIAYSANQGLKYATNVSGVWTIDEIESARVGSMSAISIDAAGGIHIAYTLTDYPNPASVIYASYISNSWKKVTIDTGAEDSNDGFQSLSLALDHFDNAHVVYFFAPDSGADELRYATDASGEWNEEAIRTDLYFDIGEHASIAIDSVGMRHIAYRLFHAGFGQCFGVCNQTGELIYTTGGPGLWSHETVHHEGWSGDFASISLDSDDKAYISFINDTSNELMYASRSTGEWVVQPVSGADQSDGLAALAIDSAGSAHVVHFEGWRYLRYSTNSSGSWSSETVDVNGYTGLYSSLAVDSAGSLHVAYYDEAASALKHSSNASGAWRVETIDSDGDVGMHASIAVDSLDHIFIAYFNNTTKDVQLASNETGSWMVQAIAEAGYDGGYTSIAVDKSRSPHISFWDYASYTVKYAIFEQGAWTVSPIQRLGYRSRASSLLIDADDTPHAFFGSPIQHAVYDGVVWSFEDLGTEDTLDPHFDVALELPRTFHVSYFEDTYSHFGEAVTHSTNSPEGWSTELVESGYRIGTYNSIAVDPAGVVHATYYAGFDALLQYANNRDGHWVYETITRTIVGLRDGFATSTAIDGSGTVHVIYNDFVDGDLKLMSRVLVPEPSAALLRVAALGALIGVSVGKGRRT